MSDVSGYLLGSAKAPCHDITCDSVPGSPLPFLFFDGVRGEPGNEPSNLCYAGFQEKFDTPPL